MIKTAIKGIGGFVLAYIYAVLLHLLCIWITPYYLTLSWGGYFLLLFVLGILDGIYASVASLILIPSAWLLKGSKWWAVISCLPILYILFYAVQLPFIGYDYGFREWVLAITWLSEILYLFGMYPVVIVPQGWERDEDS